MEERPTPEPRQWPRLIEAEDADPIEVLRTIGTYQRYLAAIQQRAIATARALGRSWEDIGGAMEMKRQSAWEKFSRRTVSSANVEVARHGRLTATTIRLGCDSCGAGRVFGLRRVDDAWLVRDDDSGTETELPGVISWKCPNCQKGNRGRVQPPINDRSRDHDQQASRQEGSARGTVRS